MASISSDLPFKKIGIGMLKSGLVTLYHDIRGDEKSFVNDVRSKVESTHVQNQALGIDGSLMDVARQHGLEKEFNDYIKKDVVGGVRGNLAHVLDITASVKDSLEDIIEGLEVGAAAASAIPTGGAGTVAITVGGTAVEVPVYIAAQTLYSGLLALLGYGSGTYALNKEGAKNYFTDVAKGYLGAVGSTVPVVGSIAEIGMHLDNPRPRIVDAASRRAEYWLLSKINEKLPEAQRVALEKERDLVDLVDQEMASIGGRARTAKDGARDYIDGIKGKLVDYGSLVKEKMSYAADFFRGNNYSTVPR